jgi:hypothetical protein
MDSVGFQGVQPRAFDRQRAGHDAHAGLLALRLVVVRLDPGADLMTPVPKGVVPDQEQRSLALGGELVTAPGREAVVIALTGHPSTGSVFKQQ